MTLLLATKPVLDICKASAKGELGKQVVEFCKFARDAMSHSDPSQPTVVQRRQSDATEAFRVLQQAFEVGLPESRLKPMPKGRSGSWDLLGWGFGGRSCPRFLGFGNYPP
eukprot:symbB.v1.2.028423.t3/scaffold3012.1/size100145/3